MNSRNTTHVIWSGYRLGVDIEAVQRYHPDDNEQVLVEQHITHRLGSDASLMFMCIGDLTDIELHNRDYRPDPDPWGQGLTTQISQISSMITIIKIVDGQPREVTMTHILDDQERIRI